MKRLIFLLLISIVIVTGTKVKANALEYCVTCFCPQEAKASSPGGDHPDETFAMDAGFRPYKPTFSSDPDAVYISNGYFEDFKNIAGFFKKSASPADTESTIETLLTSSKSLVIPSGGLYGMENSEFFKATLDEYVKQGGTLIVFAQQRGYEFNILPTPDGNPVTGYGWAEDQACFTNGVYIDTWHQMLSGQSHSTPTMNVDGYFTGIPDNSTVLLRRTANGQPAMIMYPHGNGRVIATTLYSDWAFAHGQASPEETALVRDMISWAKDATILPEISPGGTVDLNLEVNNLTSESAANIKYYVYDPDRKNLLQEVMALRIGWNNYFAL